MKDYLRFLREHWGWFVLVAAVVAFFATMASAQTVDVRPAANAALDYIFGALGTVLTVLAGVSLRFVTSKIGLQNSRLEAELASRLNDIIHRGLDYAYAAALNEVNKPGSGLQAVKVDNWFMSLALSYVNRSAPDIIKRFGISNERLQELILARVPGYLATVPITGALPTPDTTARVNKELDIPMRRTTSAVGTGEVVNVGPVNPTPEAPDTGA